MCKQFRYLRILTQGWKCLSWKLFRSSSACRIFANVVLPDFGILLWKINRGFGSFGPGWISLKFTFKVSTAEWRICFNPNTNGFSLFFAVPIPSTKLNIIKLFLAIDIIFLKWILEILGLLIYEIVLTFKVNNSSPRYKIGWHFWSKFWFRPPTRTHSGYFIG